MRKQHSIVMVYFTKSILPARDLLGAHRYRFQDLLKSLRDAEKGEAMLSMDSSE